MVTSFNIKFILGAHPGFVSENEVVNNKSILLYLKSIFDVTMKIIYQFTAFHLHKLKSKIINQNDIQISDTFNPEIKNIYLIKSHKVHFRNFKSG